MSNEIVKYDSELNTIPLRKFSPVEMNLFFSIVSRMRDKNDEVVLFSFYDLKEFRELSSGYSKTMFRLLKQFRTTGYAYFHKEDFYELLDVPKSYKQADIDKRILKPIKEELTPIFRGLTIRKKYGKGRGKPVVGYQFSFKAEAKNADDFSKTQQEEQRKKFFNIDHNSELTQEEKWLAKDKVLNLKLGTHEADFKNQQEKKERELLTKIQKKGLLEDLHKGFLN